MPEKQIATAVVGSPGPLVKIGADGQPNALQPARTQQQAIDLALDAERQIWGLDPKKMLQLAVSAVAVPSGFDFPEIKVDMPQTDEEVHTAFATCDRVYRENPRIRRTIDTHIDLMVSALDHTADEDGKPVPDDIRRVYDAFRHNIAPPVLVRKTKGGEVELPTKRITLRRLEKELLLDGWRFGNAFPFAQWYNRPVRMFTSEGFVDDGRTAWLPFITPLDPQHVFLDMQAFALGVTRYVWRSKAMPKDVINRTVERLGDYIPRGQRGSLFRGQERELSFDQLTHLSYHKPRYRPYATPPLLSLLQTAGQREQLSQMDFALANGTIAAVWLVTVGSDKIQVNNPRLLDAAADVFKNTKRTMFCVVPHWYAVQVIQPNVEGMGPAKYEQSNIETGYGLGLSLTGDPEVDAHLAVQMLDGFREDISLEYFQGLYDEIAERNGLSVTPTIRWTEPELRHDYAGDDVAWERGVMSSTTYGRRRGLDWRLEHQRVQDEPMAEPKRVPYSVSDPNRTSQQESQSQAKPGVAKDGEDQTESGGTR